MRVVLMCGGKGKRLWPLSTDNVPKQFVECFYNNNKKSSMLKNTYRKIKNYNVPTYISTQHEYSEISISQTDNSVQIISEPFSHDTFAAVLNIAVYLNLVKQINDDEIIALLPVDHETNKEFYQHIFNGEKILMREKGDFCLVGIKPTYPSTQYGYIKYNEMYVKQFIEKPNEENAIKLISSGAVWNSGILIFRLGAVIDIAKKYINFSNYEEFINNYGNLPKNSFDYEILEKQKGIYITVCDDKWSDLGSWNSLYQKISSPDSYNTNIIDTENQTIKNYGVENAIIINTANGIALYNKYDESKIIRKWGYYQILKEFESNGKAIKIKYLKIFKDNNISYQKHYYRDETWIIINGVGEIILDGYKKQIKQGDICYIKSEQKHAIKAIDTLEIIEIQSGEKTIEDDIERMEYDWEKISIL